MELYDEILDNRLAAATKAQYKSKILTFTKYLELQNHISMRTGTLQMDLLTVDVLKEFFGSVSKYTDSEGTLRFRSYQHVNGFKSAIKHMFREKKIPFPEDFQLILLDYLQGYERKIGELKLKGEVNNFEGKSPLSFLGYQFLAKEALSCASDWPLNSFAHLYLVLCWNLISRCSSVSTLMFEHISWSNDCMQIVFPTHKGDQEGRNSVPKHLFANPDNPAICPILAMGIYIFSFGLRPATLKHTLFCGENNDSRFGKWLRRVCKDRETDLHNMGLAVEDVGTHSFRKGVATFLSGIPGGPSPVSIYIRAGWSLGNVQNRYILDAAGGDQLCGRVAAGLPITDTSFSALPPHFNGPILSSDEWEYVLPNFDSFYCAKFREVVPYLLASVLYHREFLKKVMDHRHPLFFSRIWDDDIVKRLTPKILAGKGRNPISNMSASGIPPHILIGNEIGDIKSQIGLIKRDLPEELKSLLLDNFQINGAIPITSNQVREMLEELKRSLLEAVKGEISIADQPVHQQQSEQRRYATFTWRGRIHPVPETFRFPKCNCSILWDLWWSGQRSELISPFKVLMPFDIPFAGDKVLLSKARLVIRELSGDLTAEQIARLTSMEKDRIFEIEFMKMCQNLYPQRDVSVSRLAEISFLTVYDLLRKKQKTIE